MAAAWDVFSQSKFRTDTPKKVTSIVNEAWNYVSKEAYKELKIFGDLMGVQFSVANSILRNAIFVGYTTFFDNMCIVQYQFTIENWSPNIRTTSFIMLWKLTTLNSFKSNHSAYTWLKSLNSRWKSHLSPNFSFVGASLLEWFVTLFEKWEPIHFF